MPGSFLFPGDKLMPGQSVASPGGRYVLTMQGDGNLVLYDTQGANGARVAYWASNTPGHPNAFFISQTDGNLVVYAPDGKTPLWASYTQKKTPGFFVVQDDGNAVLYGPDATTAVWNVWQDNDDRASAGLLWNKVAGEVESVVGDAAHIVTSVGDWIKNNYELLSAIDAAIAVIPIAGPIVGGAIAFTEAAIAGTAELVDDVEQAEQVGQEIGDDISAIANAARALPQEEQQGFAQGVAMATSAAASDPKIQNFYNQLDATAKAGFAAALQAAGKVIPGITTSAALPGVGNMGTFLTGGFRPRPATPIGAPAPAPAPPPLPAPLPTVLQALQHAASLGDTHAAAALGTTPGASPRASAPKASAPKASPPRAAPVAPAAKKSSGAAVATLAGIGLLGFFL